MASERRTRRALRAADAGLAWYSERIVGRGLGKKTASALLPKRHVPPALLDIWKQEKRRRKMRAAQPFTALNARIRNCLGQIMDELGVREGSDPMFLGPDTVLNSITGPAEAFEPYSGLVWYAARIEKAYYNARGHVRGTEAEIAAYQAFELGCLYAEFQLMMHAGQFFEQAVLVKQRQQDAGRSSTKRSPDSRREAYFQFRAEGDKPIEAARNAAAMLKVSVTTIRNAFPGSKLPKSPDDI